MHGSEPASTPDHQLQQFVGNFFRILGAPVHAVEPGLWQVDLNPDQRNFLEPLPPFPWWLGPPAPPETVRWWIAFHPDAATRQPEARLLTRHSHLFHQMKQACKKKGLLYTATIGPMEHGVYRPLLWIYMRLVQRADTVESSIEPWECDLARGHVYPGSPPSLDRLHPGPPPPTAHIERSRLTPAEVWQHIVARITRRREMEGDGWAHRALVRMEEEMKEIRRYYATLAETEEGDVRDALEKEMHRRLEEVRGRHVPRLSVEPVAACLVYVPSDAD